jgi:hypothetical protein
MVKVVTVIAFLVASLSVHAAPVTITDALNQQQGEVTATLSDCGEIQQGGGFAKWKYLILATPAICFTGICSHDHVPPPDIPISVSNTTPKETNLPTPVPEPSSAVLVLIGLVTLWRSRKGT